MKTRTIAIRDLASLKAFALDFSREIPEKLIVLLHGPMGVGKTQFTKYLLEALGSDETVSPSFSLHNSYRTARGNVEHLDLYRLESADDLESTGFWDLFDEASGIVLIEWSERLVEMNQMNSLPRSWAKVSLTLSFEVGSETSRIASVVQL